MTTTTQNDLNDLFGGSHQPTVPAAIYPPHQGKLGPGQQPGAGEPRPSHRWSSVIFLFPWVLLCFCFPSYFCCISVLLYFIEFCLCEIFSWLNTCIITFKENKSYTYKLVLWSKQSSLLYFLRIVPLKNLSLQTPLFLLLKCSYIFKFLYLVRLALSMLCGPHGKGWWQPQPPWRPGGGVSPGRLRWCTFPLAQLLQ